MSGMRKRGEKPPGAGPAASFIGIVLLIFIFYVILIPPDERARILDEDPVTGPAGSTSFPEAQHVLLSEQVGTLGFISEEEVEHAIPNVQLLEAAEAQVLMQANPFEVSRSSFSEQTKELRFTLRPGRVRNVFLSMQAPVRHGVLRITLNGQDLFEGEVQTSTPPVISIPEQMLGSDNVLVFSVDGGFFEERRYALSDVKVIGDVFDAASQQATSSFVLSAEEFDNVERARMRFFVECLQQDVGTLDITLNGKSVYAAVPVCDALNQVDLFKGDFLPERNQLVFRLSSGGIFIETIRLETQLGETRPYIGYFTLDEDVARDVESGSREVILRIMFIDDDENKLADLNVNGVRSIIDQDDEEFELDLSERVSAGNNYVELTPRSELNIVELVVEYK